jgi:hypothetical protein
MLSEGDSWGILRVLGKWGVGSVNEGGYFFPVRRLSFEIFCVENLNKGANFTLSYLFRVVEVLGVV